MGGNPPFFGFLINGLCVLEMLMVGWHPPYGLLFRCMDGGAAAAERIKHHIAGVGGGGERPTLIKQLEPVTT